MTLPRGAAAAGLPPACQPGGPPTLQPASARARAMHRPMPRLAPVTRHTAGSTALCRRRTQGGLGDRPGAGAQRCGPQAQLSTSEAHRRMQLPRMGERSQSAIQSWPPLARLTMQRRRRRLLLDRRRVHGLPLRPHHAAGGPGAPPRGRRRCSRLENGSCGPRGSHGRAHPCRTGEGTPEQPCGQLRERQGASLWVWRERGANARTHRGKSAGAGWPASCVSLIAGKLEQRVMSSDGWRWRDWRRRCGALRGGLSAGASSPRPTPESFWCSSDSAAAAAWSAECCCDS